MRTRNLFKTVWVALFAILMLGFTACNNDDDMPVDPVDPHSEKGHDEPVKVTLTFHKGHLHGTKFHGESDKEGVKYFKATQEINFEYDDKGNLTMTDTPIRFIQDAWYALEIKYYDKDGDLMNAEFATEKNAPVHQHFFLTKNAKKLDTNTDFANADNILDYTYRDTNPVDKNIDEDGVVLRENDPIGLKGYFYVKEAYTQFDLNVLLVHIIKGTKFDNNGNPYPFNAPSKAFYSASDFNQNIPVRVYAKHPEDDAGVVKLIEDTAKEFNISVEEAEEDLDKSYGPDDGNYHM